MPSAIAAVRKPQETNVECWNKWITGYAEKGHYKMAIDKFREMESQGIKSNVRTFIAALDACAMLRDLQGGEQVYASIKAAKITLHGHLGVSLVNMYGKCGCLAEAKQSFDTFGWGNVVAWNALITAYVKCGQYRQALQLFYMMDAMPSRATYCVILGTISGPEGLAEADRVHQKIYNAGLGADVIVITALISMYGRCGKLAKARLLFDSVWSKNVVTWTAMISAYAQQGEGREALAVFGDMDVDPDGVTFVSVLDACTSIGALEEGRNIHAAMVAKGFGKYTTSGNALITMYGMCGSLREARQVFDGMQSKNLVSWNSMISAYGHQGEASGALQLYRDMMPEGVIPDKVTFASVISACASCGAYYEGREIHREVEARGWGSRLFIGNALIGFYGKCGDIDAARRLFRSMPQKDVVTYTSIISAFAASGRLEQALKLYERMEAEGIKPDRVTFISLLSACSAECNHEEGEKVLAKVMEQGLQTDSMVATSIIDMYGKCGDLKKASMTFGSLPEKNTATCNAMLLACTQHGFWEEAYKFFQMMVEFPATPNPNNVTFVCILDACANFGNLAEARSIHSEIRYFGLTTDPAVARSLIRMYARLGIVADAAELFNMLESWNRCEATYIVMLAAFGQHGLVKEALELYHCFFLDGIDVTSSSSTGAETAGDGCATGKINAAPPRAEVVFCSILSACSHAGRVAEGRDIYVSMQADHGLEPGPLHLGCMVDMLGRNGRLAEAEELVANMPFEPCSLNLMSLIAGCSIQGDVQRGSSAARKAVHLNSSQDGPYVAFSNMACTKT